MEKFAAAVSSRDLFRDIEEMIRLVSLDYRVGDRVANFIIANIANGRIRLTFNENSMNLES